MKEREEALARDSDTDARGLLVTFSSHASQDRPQVSMVAALNFSALPDAPVLLSSGVLGLKFMNRAGAATTPAPVAAPPPAPIAKKPSVSSSADSPEWVLPAAASWSGSTASVRVEEALEVEGSYLPFLLEAGAMGGASDWTVTSGKGGRRSFGGLNGRVEVCPSTSMRSLPL